MNEQELLDLIEQKKYITIKNELSELNAVDVAELLDPLELNTALLIFRTLPKDLAVDVFSYFSSDQQRDIINVITDKELSHILDELYFDDMIDMIEEMPANIVNKILRNSTQEERNMINQFLKYPEDSAGSIMTIEYVDLREEMTVKEAMAHIKEIGLTKETVYTCYVVNENRVLEGIVTLRALVTAEDDEIIKDIMESEMIYVNTHDDQENVAAIFKKYGFIALPVVDKEHRLTGIITVDDIIDVIEQEATEDFQRMAGMEPSEEAYLDTSIFVLAKNRIVWLLFLMIGAALTGGIISRYEAVLSTVTILTAFIPMIMNTGGNSGSQSATLIIRGLATGEVTWKDKFQVIRKEFGISLIVGTILASVNFMKNIFWDKVGVSVALTVSLTLICTITMAKMVGGMLPLIAKKMNLDPAIMAGPLISTLVDSMSLIVFFRIATTLLPL